MRPIEVLRDHIAGLDGQDFGAYQSIIGKTSIKKILQILTQHIQEQGLDLIDPKCTGDLSFFRDLEFAAILNRTRKLKISHPV